MRIISGIYGRRRFEVPASFSARPTTDFAKENLFNVINNLMDFEGADALDLFAGTGSISFELLSRGCRRVTAVEKNAAHASFIAKVARELKTDALDLVRGDVFRYLKSAPKEGFDIIFADPPYSLPELPEVPTRACCGWMACLSWNIRRRTISPPCRISISTRRMAPSTLVFSGEHRCVEHFT